MTSDDLSRHHVMTRLPSSRDDKNTLSSGDGRDLVGDLMPRGRGCVALTDWLRTQGRSRGRTAPPISTRSGWSPPRLGSCSSARTRSPSARSPGTHYWSSSMFKHNSLWELFIGKDPLAGCAAPLAAAVAAACSLAAADDDDDASCGTHLPNLAGASTRSREPPS